MKIKDADPAQPTSDSRSRHCSAAERSGPYIRSWRIGTSTSPKLKPKKENRIVLHPCPNFLESTVHSKALSPLGKRCSCHVGVRTHCLQRQRRWATATALEALHLLQLQDLAACGLELWGVVALGMHVYVCICEYEYMCICVCVRVHIYLYICIHLYIYIYVYICMYVCIHLSICLSVYLSVHL